MKEQNLMLRDNIDAPALTSTSFSIPLSQMMAKKTFPHKRIVTVVVLIHLLMIGAMITQTTQYHPLDIINPADQKSVEVTMVEAPQVNASPVPQATNAVPVLTANNGEREVEKVVVKPKIPPTVTKLKTHQTKIKSVKKPKVTQKTIQKREPTPPVAQHKVPQIKNAKPAAKDAIPATSRGEMLKSALNAEPKAVSTVGCQVPEPEYPRRAKRLQEEGEVLIRLVINADGSLGRSNLVRSSGFDDLDQAAMAAVSRISCNPYKENGQAISVMTVQPITFKLSR